MKSILITGTSRGIGLEFVHHYAQQGWQVYAGCRNISQASSLKNLANEYKNIKILDLDVSKPEQIEKLAKALFNIPIDILINNAGLLEPDPKAFGEVEATPWLEILKVNTIAPLLMCQAFLPNLQLGQLKIIANISSSMGSIAENDSGGYYMYRSSKAALNALTKNMAIDLKPYDITVISLHPGWVRTDMGGPNAFIDVQQSVQGLTRILENPNLGQHSGEFFNYKNELIRW